MDRFTLQDEYISLMNKITDEPLLVVNLHERKVIFVDSRIAEFFKIPICEGLSFDQLCKPIDKKFIRIKDELFSNTRKAFFALPEDKRYDYVINCNIPVDNGFVDWVHLRIIPIEDNSLPPFSYFIIIVTISPNLKSFLLSIECKQDDTLYMYDKEKHCWQTTTKMNLTEEELIILRMTCAGYSMNEIADKLYRSVDTIKYHIKIINKKFGVHHLHFAIFSAMINRKI